MTRLLPLNQAALCFASGAPRIRRFSRILLLVASCFLAAPAWPQATCIVPPGVDTNPSGSGFFASFANSRYEIAIPSGNGTNVNFGDLNTTYFEMYYSIANLNTWMAANNYCPVELIIVGTFSDVRHFSVTDNDMHYAATQHLADADIDPVGAPGSSYSNPFTPGVQYSGSQKYLVPVSLGYVPGSTTVPGCSITPFEDDNLLDATQRHLSMDWNTNVQVPTPGVAHVVDTPEHAAGPNNSGPNTAGSIIVRNYLGPPLTCTGPPGSVSCLPPQTPIQQPYVIVRDVQTGCAYKASWLQPPTNHLVYAPSHTMKTPNCAQANPPAPCGAILSTRDLTAQNVPNWLDLIQHHTHTINANITPQACYANGSPSATLPLPFANEVAWVRSPEYVSTPGPDDSYIGGAVSSSDLVGMLGGSGASCAQQQSGDGCVIRFRFQLPAMPNTPCQAPYHCGLTGNEQLRYVSLTFGYQNAIPDNVLENAVAYPDGIVPNVNNNSHPLVSLADSAFAVTPGTGSTAGNNYVTLIVNVGASLPAWLQQTTASGAVGVPGGVQPVLNPDTYSSYSVWQVQGYTVLDLSQFYAAGFSTSLPLLLSIRNTLPGSTFGCSGAAIPFSMAEYTNADGNGGGLMGPYVPLVDYIDPNNLPQPAGVLSLPSASSCGLLPSNATPSLNNPTGENQLNFPQQYWPSSPIDSLNCGAVTALLPEIYFAATQFATPATTQFGQSCANATQPNPCNQIIEQTPQTTESFGTWQPPLPVTIVGTNFGFLPSGNLPQAVASSNYVEVSDDGAGSGLPWDTNNFASCQMYIANWTNASVTLAANLPVGVTDLYQTAVVLSPLADVSPLTFGAAPPFSTTGCPVASGDNLTFTVTNPQSGVTSIPITVPVSQMGTTPY
jgi:hypothetical protein